MNPEPDLPRIHDRYELLAFLGEGGLGTTYLVADHLQGERRLALKLLPAERFARVPNQEVEEVFRAWTRLRHPNLAQGYEFARDEPTGMATLAVEYVPGDGFFEAAAGESMDALARWARRTCAALAYLHHQGFLHGNLKPENLRVEPGENGRVVLLDPCLAEWMAPPRGSRRMRRQHFYTAPEVLLNHPASIASDLYSFGVVLFEAATRRLPFSADDPLSLLRRHLSMDAPDPRTINSRIPVGLARTILRLLAKVPGERFARAEEVAEALERVGTPMRSDTRRVQRQFVPWGRLVGRDPALAEFRSHLDRWCGAAAWSARPPLLAFTSGPGGGKSRLLRELRSQAQFSGVSYLAVRCPETPAAPFEPLADLVEQWTHLAEDVVDATTRARLEADFADVLDLLLRGKVPAPGSGIDFSARAADLLIEASRSIPLLVALDDFHRADAGTLAAIGEVLERLAEERPGDRPPRLTLVAAARSDSAGPAAGWLRRARVRRLARFHPLPPLDPEEVKLLARSMAGQLGDEAAEHMGLGTRAAGSPLVVEELLGARFEPGSPQDAPLPASLPELTARKLGELGPEARDAAAWVAVHGRRLGAEALAQLSGRSVDAAQAALDEAEKRRLLARDRIQGRHARYRFLHDSMAEEVYRTLPADERAERHRRVATLLRLAPADGAVAGAAEIAHHALAGGETAAAGTALVEGARQAAALGLWQEAAIVYERALLLAQPAPGRDAASLPGRPAAPTGTESHDDAREEPPQDDGPHGGALEWPAEDPGRRATEPWTGEVTLEWLGALVHAGSSETALNACGRVIEDEDAGPAVRSGALAWRARILRTLGHGAEARDAARLACSEAGFAEASAAVASALAAAAWFAEPVDADAAYARALAAATAAGSRESAGALLADLGGHYAALGEDGRAESALRASIASARRDRRLGDAAASLCDLGAWLAARGRLDRAADRLREAAEMGVFLGIPARIRPLLLLARVELALGDPASARVRAEDACRFAGRGDHPGPRAGALVLLGRAALDLGELAESLERLDEARHAARTEGDPVADAEARLAWGLLHASAGERDVARAVAADLLDRAEALPAELAWAAHDLLGRTASAGDGPAAAVACFERALAQACALHRPVTVYAALSRLALARADAGATSAEIGELADRVGRLRLRGCAELPEQALLDLAWARACLHEGRGSEARAALDRALDTPAVAASPDLHWRLLGERARWADAAGRPDEAAHYFRATMDVLRRVWIRLPDRWRESWLHDPEKRRLREDALGALTRPLGLP